MSEDIVVTSAKYLISAVNKGQYLDKLPQNAPEIAFIGRSNVGKSSLINSLTRIKGLARVSASPGKTQTINFYDVKIKRDEVRKNFYLVDLPGYGYAKTGREQRKIWAKFIEEYFLTSEHLAFVCLLLDLRREPMPHDIEMFNFLVKNNIPVLPVGTKADKLGKTAVQKQIIAIKKALRTEELTILPYSAVKHTGRQELLEVILDFIDDTVKINLSEFDKSLLNIIQEHLPIAKRPYQEIAEKLGVSEEEVITRLKELKDAGYIRRMGAFFDSAKLGYTGTLVALKVSEDKIPNVAEAVNKYAGVTHNYEREGEYNLWFTLLSQNEETEQKILREVKELEGVKSMLNLKANHKYKINVAFKLK